MFLTYDNLTIRNAEAKDAKTLCRWWNDGAVMAHAGFPLGLGTSVEKIIEQISSDTDYTRRRLVIEIDGEQVGEMSYTILNGDTAEIGIKICEASYQNRGYGKKLLSMLINALFEDLRCKKIVLDTNLKNERAQHVYEELGFRKLRVNTDVWRDQMGELQSSVDYEMTREDFKSFI